MRIENLPSPGRINKSVELRRLAAKAISYAEIRRAASPATDIVASLNSFFTACAAACGGGGGGGTPVACVYALNATLEQMRAFGMPVTHALTMYESDQNGQFQILGATRTYSAAPSSIAAAFSLASGRHAFEVDMFIPDISMTSNSGTDHDVFSVQCIDIGDADNLQIVFNVDQRTGGPDGTGPHPHRLMFSSNNDWPGVSVDVTDRRNTAVRVRVVTDASTGSIELHVAGVPVDLSAVPTTGQFTFGTQYVFLMYGWDKPVLSNNTGDIAGARLYPSFDDHLIRNTGDIDICGNVAE